MERKINHKVGVKLLSDVQLENIMPTYLNLFHKIDVCREVANEELEKKKKHGERRYQYNLLYDNVFSILGKRGTGKTSVAFTLREKILERYADYHDVVLPLIIPEIIPENCTVLGWLLAIVREELEGLENQIAKEEKGHYGKDAWDRCRYKNWQDGENSLLALYDELSQLFYAGSYNPSNEESYYRAVDNSVRQAEDYYKFAKRIANLWDAWVERIQDLQEYQREERGQEGKQGKRPAGSCPMIYFIFDDVDLAPEKIEELLSVIIKYLSHPNIVVIATADEELFLEVIENRLDNNIGRLPKEWRNYLKGGQGRKEYLWNVSRDDEEERVKDDLLGQTARMYLGKVLPTSTRFYLRLFHTAKQKELFCLESDEKLGEGVKNQIQSLIDCIYGCSEDKISNFICPEGEDVNFYLKFIGNTSRQIGNVYIALQELVMNLKDTVVKGRDGEYIKDRLLMQVYQSCRYFFCVAINANHSLSNMVEPIDEFVDEIFLPEYNQWKMYCNYSFLNEYLHEKFHKEKQQARIEIGLQLYSLLVFGENILLIMEKGIPDGITGRGKTHAVALLTEYLSEIAFEKRHVFREDLEPNLFFGHYVNLLDRLDVIVADEMSDMKFNMEYFYDFKTYGKSCEVSDVKEMYSANRKWFRELTGMLTMVYGNAYLVSKKDMEDCLVYTNRTYLTRYQRRIDTEIKNHIKNCFSIIKLQEGWSRIKGNVEALMEAEYEDPSLFFGFVEKINDVLIKKEGKSVGLRQVLDLTFSSIQNYPGDNVIKNMPYFSQDILKDIQRMGKKMLDSPEDTKELMLKHIAKIAGDSVGRYAILRDIENAVNVLDFCALRYLPMAASIKEISQKILIAEREGNAAKLERSIYSDFIGILVNILGSMSDEIQNGNYWDEEIKLRKDVEELFGDLDITIEVTESPSEEMIEAVELGQRVVFVEILQLIYIYQIVQERYGNGSSMSSKELEKVKREGREDDTYYYQLFLFLTEIVENGMVLASGDEYADMKEDIRNALLQERYKYVNFLIERIENE